MACYIALCRIRRIDIERMAYAYTSRRTTGRKPVARAASTGAGHGRKMGTWKMAYADFLTALMAFFLLMWLISGVSPEERAELANYFSDTGAASAEALTPTGISENRIIAALAAHPVLTDAGPSVRVIEIADGVRIDLVDSDARPLFTTGSDTLSPAGQELARAVALALAHGVEPLTLEGHTDAFPSVAKEYSNWELSSARAHDARRTMVLAGLAADRITAVTGYGDTRPLIKGQPHLSANRRVSILIHTEELAP